MVGWEIYETTCVSRGLESIVKRGEARSRGDHDSFQPSPFATPRRRRVRDEDYTSRHEHRADTRSSVFIPLINANDSQPSSKRSRRAPSRVTLAVSLEGGLLLFAIPRLKIYRSLDINVPIDYFRISLSFRETIAVKMRIWHRRYSVLDVALRFFERE